MALRKPIYNVLLLIFCISLISGNTLAQAVTNELVVKGAYLKVGSNSSFVTVSNSVTNTSVSNSGFLVVEDGGTFVTSGDLSILASSNVQTDGTVELKKSFTNDGNASMTLAGGSEGTVKFSGSASQSISGSTTTIFENFEIDNSSGISLSQNIDVSKSLNFTDGIITTNAQRVDLSGTSANNVSGSGVGKYIVGSLRRYVTNNVTYTLPIGTAAQYEESELFVNSNTGLSYVDVVFTVSAEAVPGGLQVNGINVNNFLNYGYWTLNPNGGVTAVNYNFTGTSRGHTDLGGDQDNYALITDIGSGWQDIGPHSSATQVYTASAVTAARNTLTSFGSYVNAYLSSPLYTAPAVTQELNIKGSTAIFKSGDNNNFVTLNNASTTTNTVSGGTLTIKDGATFLTSGDVINQASGKIKIDGTLELKKDFSNSGTASLELAGGTNGLVKFSGTAQQSIAGSVTTIFENFEIDNTGGISLGQNVDISDSLTFTNGIITTNAQRVELSGTSTNNVIGPGTGKYVVGNFRRYVTNNVTYTLPVGTATQYEEAEFFVNSSTGLTYVDVVFTVSAEAVPGGLQVNGINVNNFLDYGFWTLNPNGGVTAVNYNFSGTSNGHTDLGGDQDNYALITDIGSGWQDLGPHSSATQIYSATAVTAVRNTLTTLGSYINAYLSSPLYTAPPVTQELNIKGATAIFKAGDNDNFVTINNTSTTTNTVSGGTLSVKENATFLTNGDLVNQASGTIEIEGTIELKKGFTNDGTASLELAGGVNGLVKFSGTSSQSISGSTTTIFENFEIDNTSGISLSQNIDISDSLNFTNGIITTNAQRVDLSGTSADNVIGAGVGKFVLGNFRRYVANSVEYTLPIGTAAQYEEAKLFVNSSTGLTYVDASFTTSAEAVPGGLQVNSINVDNFLNYGYWTLAPNGGVTAVNYNFTGTSRGHTDLGGNQDNYALITDIGSGWQDIGPHSIATQTYSGTEVTAARNTLTTLGSYVVAYLSSPLYTAPVVTQELNVKGSTAIFKVGDDSSFVTINNANTTANTLSGGTISIKNGATMLTNGDLANQASGNIKIDGTLEMKKGFTNDGTASLELAGGTNGLVKFSGTGVQTIGGTTTSVFENFEINNASGISLNQNIDIADTLTFSTGIITTNAQRVDISGTSASNVEGAGAGNYVLGSLRRYVTNGVDYTLPIGTAAQYEEAKLFVNSHTGLSYVDVVFTISAEAVPGGLQVNGINVDNFLDYGFWTLNPNAGVTAINYNFTGTSTGHTDLGGGQDNYALLTDIGSGWQDIGPHSIATQVYSASTVTAARNTLTTLGSYVIGYLSAPLYTAPVVTEELNIKGATAIFKAGNDSAVVNISNANTTTNTLNGGTLSIANEGNFITNGDVVNQASGNIKIDGVLELKKGFTNDGTASLELAGGVNGTVKFTGSAAQSISGSTTSIFENFEIDNSNGISLSANIDIADSLTFTDGIITTNAQRVDLSGTAVDNVVGAGVGKYVLGNFRRYVTNNVEYTLPIGTAAQYEEAKLFVNSSTGLTYVDVVFTVSAEAVPGGLQVNGVNVDNMLDYGFWTLNPNGGLTAVNYNFTGATRGHTDLGGTQDNYALITDVGSGWQDIGPHSVATQIYSATEVTTARNTLTAFGSYVGAYLSAGLYTPHPVTTEFLVKGTYFKIPSADTVFVKGSDTDVKNRSGGTITINGGLRMEGEWDNAANANISNAVFSFEGTGNQNFGGATPLTIKGIKMTKSANNLTLQGDVTLTNLLTLDGGDIDLNGNDLTFEDGHSVTNTPDDDSHIIATNGNVIQKFPSTGTAYLIPIGDGTSYTPVDFTLNSATGLDGTSEISFNVVDAKHPNHNASEHITRYFNYNQTNINNPNYDITIYYTDADIVGSENNLSFAIYSGGAWTHNTGVLANTAANSITWAGATTFSAGTGTKDGEPLPVELLSFEAHKTSNQKVLVQWTTASEINNDYFEVQRSLDGTYYETIGTVEGAGNSFGLIEYDFIDHNPYQGVSFYRLKQVDFDETEALSHIVTVNFDASNLANLEFKLYPNPVDDDYVNLVLSNEVGKNQNFEISLFNSFGQKILSESMESNDFGVARKSIDLSAFSSGSYYILISNNGNISNKEKIIINH